MIPDLTPLAPTPQTCTSLPLVGRDGVGGRSAGHLRNPLSYGSPLPQPLPQPLPMSGRGDPASRSMPR